MRVVPSTPCGGAGAVDPPIASAPDMETLALSRRRHWMVEPRAVVLLFAAPRAPQHTAASPYPCGRILGTACVERVVDPHTLRLVKTANGLRALEPPGLKALELSAVTVRLACCMPQ